MTDQKGNNVKEEEAGEETRREEQSRIEKRKEKQSKKEKTISQRDPH